MKQFINTFNKYSFHMLFVIIFISFLFININVIYFGDDYYFLQYRDYGFIEHFQHLFSFYCTDNGRFIVHLLVTFFLKLPMIYWQVFNSIMLTSICLLIAKITSTNSKNKSLILLISFFLISSIEIKVTRQSVYWLTGSFNYVYPCFILLIYTYLLTKTENKKYYYFSLVFGFLSSASMEQSAIMTFGLTLLFFLSEFKGYKKIIQTLKNNKKLIVLLIVTLIGACSVLLAPAQFNRIMLETKEISFIDNTIENIKLILNFYTQSITIFYFHLLFLVFGIIFIVQQEQKNIIKASMIVIYLLCIILLANLCYLGFFNRILKYVFLILLGICFLYCNNTIYSKKTSPLIVTALLLIGSQLMMIFSPVLGYRNFIFGLISYTFIIGLIISKIVIKNYFICSFNTLLLISAIWVNYTIAQGYYNNKIIQEKNIAIITNSDTEKHNQNSSITLYKYLNDNYSWCAPYTSEFHLEYYKKVFKIENTINWI